MDGGSLSEDDLFNFLKKRIPDLQKTGMFDSTDVFSLEYNLRAELKCRRTHYDLLLIERDKWNNLKRSKERNLRYINSTPKGIYSFDVNNIKEPDWFVHLMPKTTDFYETFKINKQVGYLPISLAKRIDGNDSD